MSNVWVQRATNGNLLYYCQDTLGKWIQSYDPLGKDFEWFKEHFSSVKSELVERLKDDDEPISMMSLMTIV